MTMLSTLVSGWLIGAAMAAPVPSYDASSALAGPPWTQQEQAERERQQAEQEAERARQEAQREAERAQQEAERERQQALQEAERERQQAEVEAARERERAARERAQARERANRERRQALEQAARERQQAQQEAERERQQALQEAERERQRTRQEADRERQQALQEAERERQRSHQRGSRGKSEYVQLEGDRMSKTFNVGREGSLLLHNVSGDITVTAGGGSELRVDAIKRAKGRSEGDARQQLDTLQVVMREAGGGRVEVRTEQMGRESRAWVDFHVVMPAGAGAEIHSVSGDISITGVKGELRAETVSGDVRAVGVQRLALLKTISGDVEIDGADTDGTLSLSSVNGDVRATNIKARAVEVSSVSGDAALRQCTCERVQTNSVNGSVEFSGRLSKTGRYEFKAHSGDITLYYQANGFDLTATTFSGDITFDPPIASAIKMNTNRYGPGRSARGSVGGGGASVELTTFSGDIMVAKGQ